LITSPFPHRSSGRVRNGRWPSTLEKVPALDFRKQLEDGSPLFTLILQGGSVGDILFARTFMIVGTMLILTAITAKKNRVFETPLEMWGTVIATFALLFAVMGFSSYFPLNLFLVGAFSLVIGWSIGPTIEYFGARFKLRKFLKNKGTRLKKGESPTSEQLAEFGRSFDKMAYHNEWQNIVTQAFLGTALAVITTACVVFTTDIDFDFLGRFLFIALLMLVVMGLINAFFIRSRIVSLAKAYIGAVVFTLYLLFDFNQLEKKAGDESWSTAINISVNIYLDIVNLFLDLLQILADSD
jgi:FtsH-binding integral membrane protein